MDRRLKHRDRRQSGFTLIELLIVLLIIALTASVVALNAPPPTGKARLEADRFAARMQLAAEQAVMTGALIGLELTPSSYRFFRYERGDWRAIDTRQMQEGIFPADVAVAFELADLSRKNEEQQEVSVDEAIAAPNVLFSPTGETTSLTVDFRSRRARVSLILDDAGELEVVRHGRGE